LEVDTGPDREKENSEKERLEGFNIALEFMTVRAAREHDAGDESAEGGRESHGVHEEGGSYDEGEGGGIECLGDLEAGDPAEPWGEGELANHDDDGNGGENDETFSQRGEGVHPFGDPVFGLVIGRGGFDGPMGQSREESEDGDDCDVLEEEDGEALFSRTGFGEPAFLEGLHHDGSR